MKKIRLTFLAVGQGNGFMMEVFETYTQELVGLALFDFGGDDINNSYVQSSINMLCNAMEIRATQKNLPGYYLDFLCITHQDRDHWNKLKYLVSCVTEDMPLTIFKYFINFYSDNKSYKKLCIQLKERSAYGCLNPTVNNKFYSLCDDISKRVYFQILASGTGRSSVVQDCQDDANGYNTSSIVLKIYGDCPNFVLTGDATAHTMKYILDVWQYKIPYSVVMSAPHHGSYTTAKGYYVTSDITGQVQQHDVYKEFFDRLRPNRIVVSAGMHGRYGHPHFTMMEYYDTILSRYRNIDDQHDIWVNQNDNSSPNYGKFNVESRLYTTQRELDDNENKIFVHQIIETNATGEVNHSEVIAEVVDASLPKEIGCIDNLNGSQSQMGLLKEQSRNIRSCRAVAHKVRK